MKILNVEKTSRDIFDQDSGLMVFKTFSFGAYWSHNLELKSHLVVNSGSNVIKNPLQKHIFLKMYINVVSDCPNIVVFGRRIGATNQR